MTWLFTLYPASSQTKCVSVNEVEGLLSMSGGGGIHKLQYLESVRAYEKSIDHLNFMKNPSLVKHTVFFNDLCNRC